MTAPRSGRVPGAPELAYDVCGDEGSLVIFMHGIGGHRGNWRAQLAVAEHGYRVVALDCRGYGDSADYDGDLEFRHFSEDLCRLLDHLEVPEAHLVGLSMGGRVALDFYGHYPDRVRSLTLADTSANSADAVDPDKVREFLDLRLAPLRDGKEPADIAADVAESLICDSTPPAIRAELEQCLGALHKESYMKTLSCVTQYSDFPAFSDVAVPTLVIAGDKDRIAKPAMVESMAQALPDSRLVWLSPAGHVSNLEQPEQFNKALLSFLRDVEARTPELDPRGYAS